MAAKKTTKVHKSVKSARRAAGAKKAARTRARNAKREATPKKKAPVLKLVPKTELLHSPLPLDEKPIETLIRFSNDPLFAKVFDSDTVLRVQLCARAVKQELEDYVGVAMVADIALSDNDKLRGRKPPAYETEAGEFDQVVLKREDEGEEAEEADVEEVYFDPLRPQVGELAEEDEDEGEVGMRESSHPDDDEIDEVDDVEDEDEDEA